MTERHPRGIESIELRAGFSALVYDVRNSEAHGPAQEVMAQFSDSEYVGEHRTSNLSESNKRSEGFYVCIAVIVCGMSVKTGKPMSFLMHYNPLVHFDLPSQEHKLDGYTAQQKKLLNEFKVQMQTVAAELVPSSVSHMICGGHANPQRDANAYSAATNAFSEVLKHVFHSQTSILAPPVNYGGDGKPMGVTNVYVDTQKQKVHVLRYSPE